MGQNQKMNVCCMWVVIIVPFPTIINEEQSLFTNQNSNPNLTISNHVKNIDFFKFKNKDRKRRSNLVNEERSNTNARRNDAKMDA